MTRERDRIQENANKYTVKNCPCIKHFEEVELDNRCMSTQDDKLFFCENNTDCVIKQVITDEFEEMDFEQQKHYCDAISNDIANKINEVLPKEGQINE